MIQNKEVPIATSNLAERQYDIGSCATITVCDSEEGRLTQLTVSSWHFKIIFYKLCYGKLWINTGLSHLTISLLMEGGGCISLNGKAIFPTIVYCVFLIQNFLKIMKIIILSKTIFCIFSSHNFDFFFKMNEKFRKYLKLWENTFKLYFQVFKKSYGLLKFNIFVD